MAVPNGLEKAQEKEGMNKTLDEQEMDFNGKYMARKDKEEDGTFQSTQSMLAPPDGGWGWVVVLGGGLGLSIMTGFNKTITLVYEQWLDRYGKSAAATSSVTSLNGTIRMIASPLVGVLINHTSHRTVGILAGMTCSLSILLTAFMPSLFWIYITYGIIHGIGISMYFTAELSMVNLYFSKNRGKANAVESCFIGVGALYMTQLVSYLLDEYGYRGTLLIIGAIMLNQIPAAGLFRPLKIGKATQALQTNVLSHEATEHEYEIDKMDHDQRTNGSTLHNGCDSKGQGKDISEDKQQQSKSNILFVIFNPVRKCGATLGFGALRNYGFFVCAVLMSSYSVVNSLNMSLLAGMAHEKGYTKPQITLLMSLNFATEVVFRLCSGLVFDSPCVRKRRLLVLSMVSTTIGVFVMVQPYVPLLIPSIACWMLQIGLMGTFQAQASTVMSDSVPRSTITSSVGLMRLFQGIGNLAGPSLGGFIRDVTGSYALGYVVAGAQISTVSLIMIIMTLCRSSR